MDDKIIEIMNLIERNYDSRMCGATSEWSHGDSDDVFDDGYECGRSWLAYEIGKILEMDLEDPNEEC